MKTLKQFNETVTTGAAPGAGSDSNTVVVSPNKHRRYREKNQQKQDIVTKYVRRVMVP